MFTKRQRKSKILLPVVSDSPSEAPLIKKPKLRECSSSQGSLFSYKDETGLRPYADGGVTTVLSSEHDSISRALSQKEISKQIYSGDIESSLYRGQNGYALYAEKSDSAIHASKYTGSVGPVKAPNNVRTTCRFDYAYGLCKDWKVSGYCGYEF